MTNGIPHDDWALTHYGVLGMKWGVRKRSQTSESRKRNSKNAAQKTALRLSTLSDSEIRSQAERKELENRYLRAVNEQDRLIMGQNKVLSALNFIATNIEPVSKLADTTNKVATTVNKIRK